MTAYYGLREERELGARLARRIAGLFAQEQWAAATALPGAAAQATDGTAHAASAIQPP